MLGGSDLGDEFGLARASVGPGLRDCGASRRQSRADLRRSMSQYMSH